MQVATSGEAGMEMAQGNAKAFPGILGETAAKGNVEAKGNGTVVKKKARDETQRSAAGEGAVCCISGVGCGSP